MRAKRNPQYDEMFLGGLVDRAKGFAEKRPGMAKAIGLGGGMLLNKAIGNKGAGLFSKMSGIGLMGMLGEKLRQRRDQDVPQVEDGAMVQKYRKGGMVYAEDSDFLTSDPKKKETAFLDAQTKSDLRVGDKTLDPQSEAGIQRLVDLGLASKAVRDDKDYTRDFTLDEGTLDDQREEYLSAQHAIMRDSPVAEIVRKGGRPGILDGEYVDSNDPAIRSAIREAIESGDKNAKFEVNVESEFEKMVDTNPELKKMFQDYFTDKGGFTDQERGFARMNNLRPGESNTELFRRFITGAGSGDQSAKGVLEDQAARMGAGFRAGTARAAEDRVHSFGMHVQDKYDTEAAKRARKYRTSIGS